MQAPKMHYRTSAHVVSVRLPFDTFTDLMAIQRVLQRESDTPTIPVSRCTAIRRSLEVYARSLRRLPGRLATESRRATASTYRKH